MRCVDPLGSVISPPDQSLILSGPELRIEVVNETLEPVLGVGVRLVDTFLRMIMLDVVSQYS